MARNISYDDAVLLGRLTLLMGKEDMSSREVDSVNDMLKQINKSPNRDELQSMLRDSLKGSSAEFRDLYGETTFPGSSRYVPPENPEPVYGQLDPQMKQNQAFDRAIESGFMGDMSRSGFTDAMRAAPRFNQAVADAPIGVDTPMGPMGTPGYLREQSLYQPSDINKTLGYVGMASSMDPTMEDREKVSVGGQTYMLPSDPVARERYRKSLMLQQAEKDSAMAGRRPVISSSPSIDAITQSSMFADMRSRPAYDQGFRKGLDATENTGMMTMDDVRGSGDDAERFRSTAFDRLQSVRFKEDPELIYQLGYLEALESAEQKMMDEDRRFLEEGISFTTSPEDIIEEPGR
jgi:hypothetical protein